MDFSNLAREFFDGLDGVLLGQKNDQRGKDAVGDPVDNRQRCAVAHHRCPSNLSLNSSLDTTQETTSSDSDEELPKRVPPGTSAPNRNRPQTSSVQRAITSTLGLHHALELSQYTTEHQSQRSPIPPRPLARSSSLKINSTERVVTIPQPPPPTTTPPLSLRESSRIPNKPVVVSPRPPRPTHTEQGYRPSVHSLADSQGSVRSRQERAAPIMCNLTELSLDVCFGGDTQQAAAAAVAAAVDEPDVPLEKRSDTLGAAGDEPDKESESRELQDNKYGPKKHLHWFGHGKFWTCFAILFAWMGMILAIWSRRSTEFVHLVTGFDVSPQYEPLHNFGMLYVELCFNATMMHDSSCQILRLSTDDVDDNLFNFSRALLGLATALGGVLAVMITTSIFWESINLKPIGISFMLTYLFQSFSLLFFDTDLCNDYTCRVGPGGILCIVASLCWLAACLGTAKMDVFKRRTIRARRRNARRLAKADRKARKRLRQKDLERINSIATAPSSRDEEEPSPEPAKGRVGVSMAW